MYIPADGKGKTSACLGQIMRAKGRGLKAAFIQFMKQDGEAGEQIFLKELLGDNSKRQEKGFSERKKNARNIGKRPVLRLPGPGTKWGR